MFKKVGLILVIIMCLVSINIVFAEENANETFGVVENSDSITIPNDEYLYQIEENHDFNNENSLQETEFNDDPYEIYVGQNKTVDGEGSADNPFSTLNLACNNVSGQDKVTVYIYEGTYYLDSHLKFNTSNLFIQGIGNVVIKNSDNNKKANVIAGKAFGLTSDSANFTMSNIIFDATDYTAGFNDHYQPEVNMGFFVQPAAQYTYYFLPFYGKTNWGTFINCSFIGFNVIDASRNSAPLNGMEYNSTFINCYFDALATGNALFGSIYDSSDIINEVPTIHRFENCSFPTAPSKLLFQYQVEGHEAYFDNVWFGKNSVSSYFYYQDGRFNGYVSRYAVFNVVENYLGNNRYEIVGKLIWNGTDDQDGMENFQPMTVTLKSEISAYSETVTLTNGSFRTIYESDTKEHDLTVTLDKQPIELLFNTTDIILEPISIYYGDDQNITGTLSQVFNGTVTITVNNRTYDVKVNESDSFTYTIKDMILKEGNYTVNVVINDAHVHGINSTILKVSKVSNYQFNPIIPDEAKVGDIVPITVKLPVDATGNVTVYIDFDEIPFSENASQNTLINISNLVYGNHKVTVVYSGDDKYVGKSQTSYIYVEKVSDYELNINIPKNNTVGDDVTITINLPSDVSGDVSLIIDGEKHVLPLIAGSAEHTIPNIAAGSHFVNAIFMGDSKYDVKVNTTVFSVEKLPTEITAENISINAGETATVNINLGENTTGRVYFDLSGKKSFKELVDGQTTFDIKDLAVGNYTLTISYDGNDKYQKSQKTINITINGLNANLKANASNITVGENAIINIEINNEATGQTNIILDKLNIPVTFTNGKATVEIPDLTNGTYTAIVKFDGDDKYLADETPVTFTVSKAELPNDSDNVTTNIPEGTTAPEFTIKLPSDATGNFTVTVDGTPYTEELVNGSATVKVPEQTPGNHTISTSYSGDKKYNGFTSDNESFNVPKASIPGGENALKMTSSQDGATPSYSINLPSDAKGNLTVVVDGKDSYTRALVNGSATVTIPELQAGKHNITVTYTGDAKYSSISKTTSVSIPEKAKPVTPTKTTKVATKITAKKKTFKAKTKVKKYTITLKAGKKPVKKVQVTLKIKGKTYKAKTNAKGKATFKIKKLTKKGKHTAVIKFKGNKNYKATSKKVKITIK